MTDGIIPSWGSPDQMFALSQQLVAQGRSLVTQLTGASFYTPQTVNVSFPQLGAPPMLSTVPPPALIDVAWSTPTQPGAFSQAPPSVQGLFPGALTAVPPSLNFGSAPQPGYGTIPAAPAVDLNFTYPTPSVTLPAGPTLLSLDVVTFNPFDIPVFDTAVPTLTISEPSIIPWTEGLGYTSDLLSTIEDEITSALTTDTDIGLTAATQSQMFDAAREREYRQQADALDALQRMETLGYAFPPGVFLDANYKVLTETSNTISGLSRDILVKQAELRLENVTRTRELAVSLEGKLIDYANQVQQRAFEAAKYQTEAAVAIYNAQVQLYNVRVEAFRALIQAYDAQIRGIEAQIEQIKAQVQYEQTKAQINETVVQTYKAQIDAALATLEVAKVQVDIIQTQANVEKLKVDVYGAEIQAFVGTVNAYTAQVEGYKANAQAQQAIEGVYRTQVEAYTAQVQAGAAQATALVEGYRAQVQGYEAQLSAFKASLEAMVEQARAGAEYNTALTTAYSAQVGAVAEYNKAAVIEWQAIINEQIQVTEAVIKEAEANAQLALSSRQISVDAIKGAASVMAQLGAAALGAIHWSSSSSWSDGYSFDRTKGVTVNTENTNYSFNV